MLSLGVTSNIDQVASAFQKMAQGQVPYATSLAINRVAELSKPALQVEMARVFDRPKPFVVNSVFIRRSNKYNLTATVFHSDKISPYLEAEIEGGSRHEKRFEIIVGNEILVPTRNVRLDSYGGVSKAYLSKVLSQAKPIGGSDRMAEYVLVRPGQESKLAPGVYQRKQGKIYALFLFKTSANYEKRYDMQGVVERVVQAEFGRQFSAAMDYALSTARIKLPG